MYEAMDSWHGRRKILGQSTNLVDSDRPHTTNVSFGRPKSRHVGTSNKLSFAQAKALDCTGALDETTTPYHPISLEEDPSQFESPLPPIRPRDVVDNVPIGVPLAKAKTKLQSERCEPSSSSGRK